VTPEAEEHLEKAREALVKARGLLEVMHYSDEAARAAYLAGFHAAQALISERTRQVAKSHSGVRSTFARLVKDDPRVDRALVRFLGRAYRFKEVADYGTGPEAVVSVAQAEEAIASAVRFVDCVASLLS
jgi:uncharacterized protein (UPF0332 family)